MTRAVKAPASVTAAGVICSLQAGVATAAPCRATVICGWTGSSESNSSVPLSERFASLCGGAYFTVVVKASPGRCWMVTVGGVTTLNQAMPVGTTTCARLQTRPAVRHRGGAVQRDVLVGLPVVGDEQGAGELARILRGAR